MKSITQKNRKRKRTVLNNYINEELSLKGKFVRFGKSTISGDGLPKRTILLQNVYLKGKLLCDHLWISIDEIINFSKIERNRAIDEIAFTGTPYRYFPFKFGKVEAKYAIGDIYITDVTNLA